MLRRSSRASARISPEADNENDQRNTSNVSDTWKSVGSVSGTVSPASPFSVIDSPFRFPVMGTPVHAKSLLSPTSMSSGGLSLSPRARAVSPGSLSPCVHATPMAPDGLMAAEVESPVSPEDN